MSTSTAIEANGVIRFPVAMRHQNCQNRNCNICLEDHNLLGELLDDLCGTGNNVDHLGRYHTWLRNNSIPNETEWGWAAPEAFDAKNIVAYINETMENSAKQGQWVHCSPELLAAGVSCADTPRRVCECDHGGSHDHFVVNN